MSYTRTLRQGVKGGFGTVEDGVQGECAPTPNPDKVPDPPVCTHKTAGRRFRLAEYAIQWCALCGALGVFVDRELVGWVKPAPHNHIDLSPGEEALGELILAAKKKARRRVFVNNTFKESSVVDSSTSTASSED